MNELQIFNNPQFGEIRTITIDGEPWTVGKDVATALGYSNPRKAMVDHVDEEDKMQGDGVTIRDSIGREQHPTIINESGLYSLVLSSKLPGAKKFRRWVTSEVLPSIRRTGGYNIPKDYPSALRALADSEERRMALEAENEAMKPKSLFADSVASSDSTILVGEMAKILKQNGIKIGQNRLFEWLRKNGYLVSGSYRSDYNTPTQRSMELGLFEVKETSILHKDGTVTVNLTPKVTTKGQQYFVKLFLGENKKIDKHKLTTDIYIY